MIYNVFLETAQELATLLSEVNPDVHIYLTAGYYLRALAVFGNVTGVDPRSLGDTECSGFELGLSRAQVRRCRAWPTINLPPKGRWC